MQTLFFTARSFHRSSDAAALDNDTPPSLDRATDPTAALATERWYRDHVKRFFGVSGPEYDRLFGLHSLKHKETSKDGPVAFDGLCCDGASNYIKLLWDEAGRWKEADFKARSFPRKAKDA